MTKQTFWIFKNLVVGAYKEQKELNLNEKVLCEGWDRTFEIRGYSRDKAFYAIENIETRDQKGTILWVSRKDLTPV